MKKVLDVDGDGQVTALGDGLMVIRKLFGAAFAGDALTSKAISTDATRTTDEIHDYIEAISNPSLSLDSESEEGDSSPEVDDQSHTHNSDHVHANDTVANPEEHTHLYDHSHSNEDGHDHDIETHLSDDQGYDSDHDDSIILVMNHKDLSQILKHHLLKSSSTESELEIPKLEEGTLPPSAVEQSQKLSQKYQK